MVQWPRLPRFPAKMTLAHVSALLSMRELKAKAFLSDTRQPDVSHFSSPLIYLDADKFVLLSDFTLLEKI